MAAIATFALKAGVWFRRGRLLIVSPDSLGTACPLSGRNSTYRPVQILEASSAHECGSAIEGTWPGAAGAAQAGRQLSTPSTRRKPLVPRRPRPARCERIIVD